MAETRTRRPDPSEEGIRLQKALAQAGVASRRKAEELIDEGRVEVNGQIVIEQGRRVDPERDVIRVDGGRIPPPRRHLYLVLNKPRGVLSAMEDDQGRPTLASYVPAKQRLFHVGRLDADTQGLLLLTNDGEFANRLAHPRYEVPKTYLAQVHGLVDAKTLRHLRGTTMLDDGPVTPDEVKVVSSGASRCLVSITVHEGRNRIIRRLMDAYDHPVEQLSRTRIGPVLLGQLGVGQTRELTRDELGRLLDLVGL
ncbi:MAG: rRNA pseudouridine synthase [Propionibacteriaceae bacterium]|nr:rRNA pseudouridine synthase [Propionibacteriaceae bacterium]